MRGKDRRTLQIMASIYGAQAIGHRGPLSVEQVIESAVACALLTMNTAEKWLEKAGKVEKVAEVVQAKEVGR